MHKRKFVVYKATSKSTGLSYVGQTKQTLEARVKGHKSSATRRWRISSKFNDAILDQGIDNFIWEVITSADSPEGADLLEKEYIRRFDTFFNGYNSTPDGQAIRQRPKVCGCI